MHFGEKLDEDRFLALIDRAYEKGARTFMTADVYGQGASDEMLARGLADKPRDSYCLVGAVGHDFYNGERAGSRGFPRALLAFEVPHRLPAALADILDTLGDRRIAVCREMTKLHEEVFRASVSEAIAHFGEPRGEFTLVIEGVADGLNEPPMREAEATALLARLRADGARAKESVAQVAEASGLSKRAVYRLWLDMKKGTGGDAEAPR